MSPSLPSRVSCWMGGDGLCAHEETIRRGEGQAGAKNSVKCRDGWLGLAMPPLQGLRNGCSYSYTTELYKRYRNPLHLSAVSSINPLALSSISSRLLSLRHEAV